MNNEQLLTEFRRISMLPNVLEKQLALKALKKEYRKSDYFRATHMRLKKVFALYELDRIPALLNQAHILLDSDYLATKINEVLEGVDLSLAVNKLLTLLNYDKLQEIMNEFTANDNVDLNEMLKELKTAQANLEALR